jgi:glycosyltransferase involved in cell wall biosynthesis
MTDQIDCRIYPNARRDRLVELYSSAAVLIHAAGYGVDKLAFPERLEHFGIVPVEAASVGCIPVVFDAGGPAEVMASLGSPTTFKTVGDAAHLIGTLFADPDRSDALSRELIEKSRYFSAEAFRERVHEALAGLL